MIVPLPRARRPSEENVLPLINIVFLLLIFFMIAGALSATAPFPVSPPGAPNAQTTGPPGGGIAIAADGRIALDGTEIELAALADRTRRWRESARSGVALAVRVDAGARSERLLAVIEALREAGIERIRLLAEGTEEAAG
ncbi:MAG: biopolymer transporter ExbD [Halofilum sp. (in: g-proteobacteria)]|nr:biopolymer transporter ExbD [Halofilum sp. (in: g-proteobacteria)]